MTINVITTTLTKDVTAVVQGVCPIYGISFLDINDKETWTIQFNEAATEEQISNAQAALENFDLSSYE